jgi:hypothetical protein
MGTYAQICLKELRSTCITSTSQTKLKMAAIVLMMEAVRTYETLLYFYRSTRRQQAVICILAEALQSN